MTSIGDTLRSERSRRGWTLQQVAAQTKIHPRLLEAIEEDAFSRLPCAMLARSFVQQYARALCVDEQEAVAQVNRRLAEDGLPTSFPDISDRSSRIPLLPPLADVLKQLQRESSLTAFVWLALACFACATVYTAGRHNWEKTGAVAAEPQAAMPQTAAMAAAEPQAAMPQTAAVAAVESHAATPNTPDTDTGAAYREAPSPIRVLFTATERVWISVKSDGTPIYTGTLLAEQSRQFEGSGKMTVTVGNAGGVKVTLNGKPVGPIGAAGEVRLLEFAPDGAFLNKASGS